MKALFPLCSPGFPVTHDADQAGLELKDLPVSASWVLGWKMYIQRTLKNINIFMAVKGNSKNSWKFICVFITIEIIVCGSGFSYVAQASINFLPCSHHFVCWADLPAVPQSDSFSRSTWVYGEANITKTELTLIGASENPISSAGSEHPLKGKVSNHDTPRPSS